ncbi:hypothetical protein ACOME3_009747 [Neoechinorhynchus agilis]
MSNNKHLPCLQNEENGSAVDSVRSNCIEDADSQDRCVRSAFIGTVSKFINRKPASDSLLSIKDDKMFVIPSMEMEAFGEYFHSETCSRVALDFYLACQAIKTIPEDDESIRKSVKSMHRLFVWKYMKPYAIVDVDNYVSMETLKNINKNIAVKKIGYREKFEPAAQELSYVIEKHFKNYLASKRRLERAKNNQGHFQTTDGFYMNLRKEHFKIIFYTIFA